jgi:hypothetical protein
MKLGRRNSPVIASEAKQSRIPNVELDCFASLAMTIDGSCAMLFCVVAVKQGFLA